MIGFSVIIARFPRAMLYSYTTLFRSVEEQKENVVEEKKEDVVEEKKEDVVVEEKKEAVVEEKKEDVVEEDKETGEGGGRFD